MELEAPFTSEEIVRALKDKYPPKAPGSNGFHTTFFKRYQSIVGKDIIALALKILNNHGSMTDIIMFKVFLFLKLKMMFV